MPITNSYSFLVGPLMAVVALGVIILICRWVFSTTARDQRTAQRAERARAASDYGLLVPIATVRTSDDAEMLRALLRDAAIRCTLAEDTSTGEPSAWTVLVFRSDAARALGLVSS